MYTALAALAVLLLLGAVSAVLGRGPLLADVRLDGAVLLAVTMLFVAIAMHVGLLLLVRRSPSVVRQHSPARLMMRLRAENHIHGVRALSGRRVRGGRECADGAAQSSAV